jgi:hypothetical protein
MENGALLSPHNMHNMHNILTTTRGKMAEAHGKMAEARKAVHCQKNKVEGNYVMHVMHVMQLFHFATMRTAEAL